MRYHCISVLSVLAIGLLGGLQVAKPLSPPWDHMHIKHSWNAVPRNWESLGHPPSGTTIDLYISLKPQRENALVDALHEVSEPGHSRYRSYLTKEQVAELVAPRPETLELVNSWLEHHGISSSSISTRGGNTLMLKDVPVTQANTFRFPWRCTGTAVKSTSGEPATMLSKPCNSQLRHAVVPALAVRHGNLYTVPDTRGENVLGIVGFLGDYPSPADLTAFMQKYRSEANDATFTVVEVNNGGGGEHPSDSNEEHFTPRDYAIYVCNQFARLGVRGVSVPQSSGNDGIGKGTCLRDDGTVRFGPTFPGTCPYVTVVGRTTDYEPEVAAVFSGGGFSDYFERPPYQEEAVSTLLHDLGNRYQGLYNASGRGIPDIAAQAVGARIFLNGNEREESGTSLATPVVAGIIPLLNDWLISTGQDPLDFLNPCLYGRGLAALNDITEGSNLGCGTDGFSAIAGWDPVTGLGTPNFRKMLEQLF
ncbi:subtilisin-like protein [Lactarius pseudohatsudake]|nr:subtilisin-like protein [Lactarius pseudohatsudake]